MIGWRAECMHCPTAPAFDSGKVRAGVEHHGDGAEFRALAWRVAHRDEEPRHLVRVYQFERSGFDLKSWVENG